MKVSVRRDYRVRACNDDAEVFGHPADVMQSTGEAADDDEPDVMACEDGGRLNDGDASRDLVNDVGMAREKTGRNDPCPCGSGKKYKKCCLDKDRTAQRAQPTKLRAAERDEGEALSRWPMDRSVFTPRAAEQLALGQEWRGAAVHPWTRARIHDWFAQYDHPAARLPIARLSRIRELATPALFAKLAEHGVERDAAVFTSDAGRRDGREAWAFASELLERPLEDVPTAFGLAVCELWRRLLPNRPSLEMLDELMQQGYEAIDPRRPRKAVEIWLTFTDQLLDALPSEVRDLDAADTRFPGLQSLVNWVFDAEVNVHNASRLEPSFAQRGIAWCEAMATRFDDHQSIRSLKREKAELYAIASDPDEAVRAAEELCAQHPRDAIGYAVLSDIFASERSGDTYDLDRAIQVLDEALRLPVHNADDFDLRLRLADLRKMKQAADKRS